ncbi:hypothetical protein ACFXPS_42845 [Nocardia sp. NPDC059091]|uniref:hypothetical protein n=1 Tax=unclassified Nocardia TaxID=2637762 RepID=UPI0036AFF7B9
MIRVNRQIVAGSLLAGALLATAAPAHAEAPADPQQVSNTEIASGSSDIVTGSADFLTGLTGLNRMACGTIWRQCP